MFSSDSLIYRILISIGGAILVLVGSILLALMMPDSGFFGKTMQFILMLPHFIPLLLAYNEGDQSLYFAYIIEIAMLAGFLFFLLNRKSRKNITENKTQE